MTLTTSTPGKLILLGEYAVLEGAPAIVSAVNKFARIDINKSQDNQFYFNAPNLELNGIKIIVDEFYSVKFEKDFNEVINNQLRLVKEVFIFIHKYIHSKNKSITPCSITINTSNFYFGNNKQKLGLGSSAALTVGLIKSLLKFNDLQLTNSDELFRLALQAHFEAQEKTGSGIDIAASTFGGTGIYKKSEKEFSYKHINLPKDLYIIPIWTGSSTSTLRFVSKTNQLKNTKPEKYNQILKRLTDISIQGIDSLQNNDTNNFLKIIDKFYDSLDYLGKSSGIPIISESHTTIKRLVTECKGYYKPSGAGGSDIGIAFTNDLKVKKYIINKINESQFKYIKLELAKNN